ncbi:MAG: sigma-54 dependent transcriptional regulator [Acidobacteriota bacterium]
MGLGRVVNMTITPPVVSDAGLDDLLAAVTTRLHASDNGLRLCRTIEDSVARRLTARRVRIRRPPQPCGVPLPAGRPDLLWIPIPRRSSEEPLVLEIEASARHAIDGADRRFLERVAAVCALAVEVERQVDGARLQDPHLVRDAAAPLIGQSVAMRALRDRIERIAPTGFTVLIEGESGTGKELVARQLHDLSGRREGPFVAVNCAALVESLLEAELFGIEDRTATGVRGRRGKFEHASSGTLFLDEVADLSASAQAKLLRVIQECAVQRVGSNHSVRVDIRLLVATNKRLRELVDRGSFRADLYYRLSGIELWVPPLRTRRDDIPELARYFLSRHRSIRPLELSAAAIDAMVAYDWPGNVRELERLMEASIVLARTQQLQLDDLPPAVRGRYADALQPSVLRGESLRDWASRYVRLVLERHGGNKRETCRVLDISYHTLMAHLRHPVAPRGLASPGDDHTEWQRHTHCHGAGERAGDVEAPESLGAGGHG